MRIIFLPALMNPEPLIGVLANHALHGTGDELSIGLDIGAQIAGPFDVKRLIDIDGQLPGGFPDTKNR